MKSALEAVNTTWNEIAQKLYAQAGPEGQPGAEQPGGQTSAGDAAGTDAPEGADESKVEDADYEVVDDDKKN